MNVKRLAKLTMTAAALLAVAVATTLVFGVRAEGAALESIASPLSAADEGAAPAPGG